MQRVEAQQLFLFDLGPDMQEIREAALALQRATRSPSTLKAYDVAWRAFTQWCRDTGRDSLPATSETLALYITARLQAGLKIPTVEQHLAAIAFRHRQDNKSVPSREDARNIIRGAKRTRKEQPKRRSALMPEHLRKICRKLIKRGTAVAMRDRAMLLIGFAGGLRRSSLVALDMTDIAFVKRRGIRLTVRSSKTDQTGVGQVMGIRPGAHVETDPVRALRDWLKWRGPGDGPLFTQVDRGNPVMRRVSGDMVNEIVKEAAQTVGLDPEKFGGHSLRAGCVTASHMGGAATLTIMERTGHKSIAMVQKYLRNVDPFAGPDPLAKAL